MRVAMAILLYFLLGMLFVFFAFEPVADRKLIWILVVLWPVVVVIILFSLINCAAIWIAQKLR